MYDVVYVYDADCPDPGWYPVEVQGRTQKVKDSEAQRLVDGYRGRGLDAVKGRRSIGAPVGPPR